jgi:hypothetical protein
VVIVIIRPVATLDVAPFVLNKARDVVETRMQVAPLAGRKAPVGPEIVFRALDVAHLVTQAPDLGPRELARAPAVLYALLEPLLALVDSSVARAMARHYGRSSRQERDKTCT